MASSKSLKKGQFPITCQLCEVDMKLKWKCTDCDLLMCDRCREKVHPKFKRAEEHKIVDFKQVGTCSKGLDHDFDLLAVKCEKHTEQDCCLFCQTCEQLICPSCVTKTHKAHELVEIREACETNRTRLTEEKEILETELLKLDEIETRVRQVKNVENSKYDKTRQEICDHQKAVKNEVDKYVYELIEELDGSRQIDDKSLETEKKRVNKIREVLQQRLTLALDEKDAVKMLQEGGRVLKSLDQTDEQPFYLETVSVPTFVPLANYNTVDKHHFGFLQNSVGSKTVKTDFKIKRQFLTHLEMRNVHWIIACTCTNGLWMGHNTSGNSLLQKVTPKNDVLEVLWSFDVDVLGIALYSKDDLLLCVDESRLKQVNGRTGKISDSIFDVSPLVARGVHVTKNNQIIVAAKNIGTPFPVSGRRVVITMNENGTQTAVYEHDSTEMRLFTYPERITSNSKGNIFVIDIISKEGHGRIVILEQGRVDLLNVYSGCSDVNSEQFPFMPMGLVNTPSDNVIITDLKTDTLHILNGEGRLISLFNLRNIGVKYRPCSLAINSVGLLYVGCMRDDDDDSGAAHLYELRYSGC